MAQPRNLAKTTRPRLAGVLLRTRLFDRLDDARRRSVIWVSGPAGSGKTTLLSSYLEACGLPYIWYQIDPGDADVATFFYYLRQAAGMVEDPRPADHGQQARAAGYVRGILRLVSAPLEYFQNKRQPHEDAPTRALPLLSAEYAGSLSIFTRRFFRELFSRLETPFVLVLDGYEQIPPQSPLHEVLRDALTEIPPAGCVAVVSRNAPPPTTVRLLVNQTIEVIGWADLQLNLEETSAIARSRGRNLSDDAIAQLYDKTHGWAAGVILMLQHAGMEGPAYRGPEGFVPHLMFDYLTGEIFQKLDESIQSFLMQTACVPQMTLAIARDLSGRGDAEQILADLGRTYPFLMTRVVGAEPLYEYHPMFREFLQTKASQLLTPQQRTVQQRKAAVLLERSGQLENAVELLLEAGNWTELAELIGNHAAALLDQGRAETLAQWLEDVPGEALRSNPWLYYWAGACHFPLAARESRQYYERAFAAFESQQPPDPQGLILSCSGVIDAIVYELDDLSLLDPWITRLEDLLVRFPELPSKRIEARVTCSMFWAMTLHQPGRPDIERWVARSYEASRQCEDLAVRTLVEPLVAIAFMWVGHFANAAQVIEALREALVPGASPLALTTLRNTEAMLYMLTGDYPAGEVVTRDGLGIAEQTGVHIWSYQMRSYALAAALGAGELDVALAYIEDIRAQPTGAHRQDQCLFHYFCAWEAMLRGELLRAHEEGRLAVRLATEVGNPVFELICRLAFAQVLFACDDPRKGAAQLRQVHTLARNIKNPWLEFTCLLTYADVALSHGRESSGLHSLGYALGLGREYGYQHALWWRPDVVARLCMRALEEGIEVGYVKDLIRRRGLSPTKLPVASESWPWEFKFRSFGVFVVEKDGKRLGLSKRQQKPITLLKILIALGGRNVKLSLLADMLWPRIDADYAHRSLTTTLHRLRKLLGNDEALLVREGCLTINEDICWVDTWAFDQWVAELGEYRNAAGLAAAESGLLKRMERLFHLYRGPFLANDEDHTACMARRDQLRAKLNRTVDQVCKFWLQVGESEKAIDCYQRGLECDDCAEGLYRGFMLSLHKLGRRTEAIEVYARCRRTLASTLKVEPSPETITVYQNILESGRTLPSG